MTTWGWDPPYSTSLTVTLGPVDDTIVDLPTLLWWLHASHLPSNAVYLPHNKKAPGHDDRGREP